ncbi:hypothetical protein A2U01_0104473, partial [Trifolium medium]|nr:hypothetical protein [Trifolium medium]
MDTAVPSLMSDTTTACWGRDSSSELSTYSLQ